MYEHGWAVGEALALNNEANRLLLLLATAKVQVIFT